MLPIPDAAISFEDQSVDRRLHLRAEVRAASPATVAATLTLYGCFAFRRIGISQPGNAHSPAASRRYLPIC